MKPERLHELRRADARARRLACELWERPLVLVAGAGTGKTTVLVTRVLAWSFGPGWERARATLVEEGREAAEPEDVAARVLRRVVAITFTDAAAAKMGAEVAEALLRVEADELPVWLPADVLPADVGERRLRARSLLGALDHLGAQTIHAWCRRLLVTHPLEAGLHPRLEVDAEQEIQQEIARDVVEEGLAAAYAESNGSDALALAALGGGPQELEAELLRLLDAGVTAADLAQDPLAPERVAAFRQRLLAALDAFAEAEAGACHRVASARRSHATVDALARIREHVAAVADADGLAEAVDWLPTAWEDASRRRLADWAQGSFGKGEADELGGRAERVAAAAAQLAPVLGNLADLDPAKLALARRVLSGLLVELERRMRARGVATFPMLLRATRALLVGSPQVAARVRDGIDQLLVDEFQDTDACQCDILRAVALSGPAAQRPGLFLVGDPKQSIYGWRSADLRAYDGFLADVLAAPGERATLSVNHRSVPAVLDEVERAVAPVMQEESGLQPAFEPLAASPRHEGDAGYAEGDAAPVEHWVSAAWDAAEGGPGVTRSADASRLEALALARDLRQQHDRGVAWQEMGVLFRGRGDFELYLSALRDARVPYVVEGDRSYYQRREVIEAASLVRCVLDPNDQIALVTSLRSTLVGVPDAALVPLWSRSFPALLAELEGPDPARLTALAGLLREVAEALPDDVPGLDRVRGWERAAELFCRALGRLRRCAREEPADVFVEALRGLTLFEAGEAARYLGAWRSANLDRFFREVEAQLAAAAGFHAVLRRLRRAVSEELQREEGVPRDLAEDAVQILTIHGAKGLDFGHVYVMQLHKRPGGRVARGGSAAPGPGPDGGLEYTLLGVPTLGWDRLQTQAARVEEAERIRTLYVALTRARRRLVVAGLWPAFQRNGSVERSEREGQTIGCVARARTPERDLGGWMAELAAASADRGDADGARWVFPGLAATPAPGDAPRRDDAGLPAPAACARQAERLARARDEAAAREARPFGASVSALAHDGDGAAGPPAAEPDPDAAAERRFGDGAARWRAAAGARGDAASTVARAVGTAIHRVLEGLDLSGDPAAGLARARALLAACVAAEAEASLREEVLAEASALLDALAAGPLLARLRELADAVVSRELPLLLPPQPDAGPVGFVAGVADLVYRDPADGRLVVVDYKSDRDADLDTPQARERLRAYRRQGALYQRALREALALDYEPRFELWYLRAGRVL